MTKQSIGDTVNPNTLLPEVHQMPPEIGVVQLPREFSVDTLTTELWAYLEMFDRIPDAWTVSCGVRYTRYGSGWWLETWAYVSSSPQTANWFLLESKRSPGDHVVFDLYTAFAGCVCVSGILRECSTNDLHHMPEVDLVFFENPFTHVQANLHFVAG